jgi:hypothetical protein
VTRKDWHYYTDRVLTAVLRGGRLYDEGFGGIERLNGLVDMLRGFPLNEEPPEIDVRFRSVGRRRAGVLYRRAAFESPLAEVLPEESKRVVFELMVPGHLESTDRPPVCLMLAATAEEGFARRRFFARPLIERGIAALLMENPFYGKRRPRGQLGPSLRTVADQFAMNTATVEEARAILGWLRRQGYAKVGVTGYSQGGIMAGFAGALCPFPLACVPRAAGNSARPIFTESALAQTFNWRRLAEELNGEAEARRYFSECLEPVRIDRFDPPVAPELAIIVGSRSDGFVPPAETEALHRHWKGSELRWLEAGHLTGAVLKRPPHVRAVVDAFDRLARYPSI